MKIVNWAVRNTGILMLDGTKGEVINVKTEQRYLSF